MVKSLAVPLLCAISFGVSAESISGKVIAVADCDTLTLLTEGNRQIKIRIAGIDSPEKKQDFGQRAKESLSELAYDQQADADCRKRDKYQRSVCVVMVDSKDVGLEQIRRGMAWWYRQYISEQTPQERSNYERAEVDAKMRGIGLWSAKAPVPPWDWRKTSRLLE